MPGNADVARPQDGEAAAAGDSSKLPPAQTFMAVDRRIGGCEAPLTMVDYRKASRR